MTIRIICVVDNTVKFGTDLRGEHGLSFWIETGQGNVLFDTGQSAAVLAHNLDALKLSPRAVDVLALSHAHYDHTGGLDMILAQKPGLPLYANADVFRPRYSLRDGEYRSIGLAADQADLASRASVRLNAAPVEMVPGLWTTGEIVKRPEPEGSGANLYIREGAGWQPDHYRDDMSLVLKTAAGLVLICGCCHAGLLNTLYHIERTFEGPVLAVLGGTHLVSAEVAYLEHVLSVIDERYPQTSFHLSHCTGEKAFRTLACALGGRVNACPAGSVLSFED